VVDKSNTKKLIATLVTLPLLVGAQTYIGSQGEIMPPGFGRSVHPAPPNSVDFKGQSIDLVRGDNPFRKLATENPEEFKKHVQSGKKVYYQNCFYCHGDNLEGKGLYAHGLNPLPTNFQDPATIAMLQEGFLFWRVAKGGIGLPEEGGPWDSAMPAWEEFLTADEIWQVILFLYDFTDQKPRALEHHDE